jgi:hypothetical protein
MFDNTKKCNAHFYLDDSGYELSREIFIKELFRGVEEWDQTGFMLYVGAGYVPLAVAVISWNESDAVSLFEEWARKSDRAEEIGEDEEWLKACEADPDNCPEPTYELHIEVIPNPIVRMPGED